MQAEEAHLLLFVSSGENPVDVPGPALLRRFPIGEGQEHAALLNLQSDLRHQHGQQGQGNPQGDRGEHSGHGDRCDRRLGKVHGGGEQPAELAPRIPGPLKSVVRLAHIEEKQGQPRRPVQKPAAHDVGEVLLQPQMEDIAHIPQHFVGEQEGQAEGDQPGEGIAEACGAAAHGIDYGINEGCW